VLKAYLEEARGKVDAALERFLPKSEGFGARLHEAMRYSIFSGGKRLRPCLCLMVNSALEGREAHAIPAACALEMVHTYSLIHDDLPSMDNDDFRRGRPSCHKAFDEATAILAGDALLTLAFEVIAGHTPSADLSGELVTTLAGAAGPGGMVIGQMRDLEAEKQPPDLERVTAIHETKTAAMISAAFRLGAITARAPAEEKERIARAGKSVGLAFQVVDDILDIEASSEALGKTAGKDLREGKMTYPAAVGLEASRRAAVEMTDSALALLVPEKKFTLVRDLALYMLKRTF
jgi:geranylgeranyl diphosphate synthase type II